MISRKAFTLIELLVVVAIIGILIGILLPSLKGARNSAKNAQTKAQINSLTKGLHMFYNDVGEYPDSSKRWDPTDDSSFDDPDGFTLSPRNDTVLYGAQALARAMVGKDFKGYVDPRRARNYNDDEANPTWYYDDPNASPEYVSPFPREDIYMSEKHDFVRTAAPAGSTEEQLKGVRPDSITVDNTQHVIVDAFDRPLLYYRANPRGRNKIVAGNAANSDGFTEYDPSLIPYYSHLDNDVFTGSFVTNEEGWRFATGKHQLIGLACGDQTDPDFDPDELDCLNPASDGESYSNSFVKYIHDHAAEQASAGVARPYNPDTYLLISAGVDGLLGTSDDVNNFQQRN